MSRATKFDSSDAATVTFLTRRPVAACRGF
jgi:hypothetical protein